MTSHDQRQSAQPNQPLIPTNTLWSLGVLRVLDDASCLTTPQLSDRFDELYQPHYAVPDQGQLSEILSILTDQGLIEVCDAGSSFHHAAYRLTASGRVSRDQTLASLNTVVGVEEAALAAERETIERLRTDLLSTVSHELRTPLTLIRTSIGLLLDSEPDEVMRARLLRNIKQSTDRMHSLVTDLLDLVRLRQDRTELHLRAVDTGELVTSAIALMRPLIDEKEQSLIIEVPEPAPFVLGDYRRLERVLLNLISNANIFSPPGATITVTVAQDGQEVTMKVADTGAGIPPDAQQHLFEQFYTDRTSSTSHNIGVGLGLPIAKGIAEAHGGRIIVDSTVGVGSTFAVILPCYLAATEAQDEDPGR
ncbi:MAG TPA: HAMP domain-containing sensor histidine kinase [Thermomicrobiales bacterium]|nr:HAMP domain-containing sensor histidine kinase [Thermomicrobiales bacterium]